MSPIRSSLLLGAGDAAAGGFQVSRSLRFEANDSSNLSRTPSVAGNRRKWSLSFWWKRSGVGVQRLLRFGTGTSDSSLFDVYTGSTDYLSISGYSNDFLRTTQVFRDYSAWYHIVIVADTDNATSSNRLQLYVNGSRVTSFSTEYYPTGDLGANNTQLHTFGAANSQYLSAYLANIQFIDGQALTPSSFTEVSATTGQLIPKAYSGSYGTNGFYLQFADNSSNTASTLGKDTSGNGNNWTPNNLSVTAGSGNDSLVDTPTSYGTDTGVGGEVRGNYATFNPLTKAYSSDTFSDGNLKMVGGYAYASTRSSIGFIVGQGKFYTEITRTVYSSSSDDYGVGIHDNPVPGGAGNNCLYFANGDKSIDNTRTAYGASYGNNNVIGIAVDTNAQTVTFYKDGASQGSISYTFSGKVYFIATSGGGSFSSGDTVIGNFGQRAFAYTAPSGFKALCDTNLPTPVVAKPNTLMDVKLYTGNGSTQSITGLAFSPDFVWVKGRDVSRNHFLADTVRGTTKALLSDSTDAEYTNANYITAFNSDGFSIGSDSGYNASSSTYVAWTWDAGTSTVSNTQGSITSQVRANVSAGFSVVTWSGNGNATIGHGLGVAPQFIICKKRDGTADWQTGHTSIGWTKRLALNLQTTEETTISAWNNTAPTSTVFSVGNTSNFGGSMVSYCFAPVAGYSSFGSYVGNGSSDGPMVWTGFRPRWILWKRSDSGSNSWVMIDAARNTYNVVNNELYANLSIAEGVFTWADFLSNGFKLRSADSAGNSSGATYIYACFAESPFQYARAR